MNAAAREHARKGYLVVANTTATPCDFFGLTVLEETVINMLGAPTDAPEYEGDEGALSGLTLPAGLFLPIAGSYITLTSGKVILWKD